MKPAPRRCEEWEPVDRPMEIRLAAPKSCGQTNQCVLSEGGMCTHMHVTAWLSGQRM